MVPLRFAILGTGFWSRFQLAAWQQVGGVECVALYNRTRAKAEGLAHEFGVPSVYDDAEQLMQRESLDFVDIITDVDTHRRFVELAALHRLPVICQKPIAPTLADATYMVNTCRLAGVPFYIHENWRWQTPIRQVQNVLATGVIGQPFRARIDMISGFPVFANQPFLKELKQFILTDLGSHILDVARFLFGEARSLYCQTRRVHTDIQGEDVATVMMAMQARDVTAPSPCTVVCELAYAGNALEREHFPQTSLFVEGSAGSLELGPDYWVRVTTAQGTLIKRYPPPRYAWADPAYDVVHASIVPCNANLLAALRGEGVAETAAEDNLQTARLVFAAYDSARENKVIDL
jgi:predicted dehydrogenase